MSSTKDIAIYETGNGGDIAIINNDIALGESLFMQPYLAMFGGNVEADTLGNELATQIRHDWWGNSAIFSGSAAKQFNSQTERAIANNTLNSAGRINIQRAAEADLAHLKSIADITVAVSVLGPKKLSIVVNMTQPANGENAQLQLLWDNGKMEVIINREI